MTYTKTILTRSLFSLLVAFSAAILPVTARAITITSGPTFTNAPNAPLACVLLLTTDEPSRVSVSVTEGTNTWDRHFTTFAKSHAQPLYGFKPSKVNKITVTVHNKRRETFTAPTQLTFGTSVLPSDMPKINVLVSKPDKMEPGYTLFRVQNNNGNRAYSTIVDNSGDVVWYSPVTSTLDIRQLPNGNLFGPQGSAFLEFNMLGQTVKSYPAAPNFTVNFHDGVPTSRGTILYFSDASRTLTNFPNSATNPNAPHVTTNVLYDRVVEVSMTNNQVFTNWTLMDMLDPRRLTYLTFAIRSPSLGWDIEHPNAIIEDPRDNSFIVSMRHQNAIIKFSRAGELKWILGPHENWGPEFAPYLLTPVGTPFFWNYAQHAPMITPQGTLLVYDNGNFRATPFDSFVQDTNNYTRVVEYDINEQTMEVSQVWDYGRDNADERIFTDRVGNTDWLPVTGNVLVTFGNVNYIDGLPPSLVAPTATMFRVKEVTHEDIPEVVFDLALFDFSNAVATYRGCFGYRSHRIPDIYGHPALPVSDLDVTCENGIPHLQFSGDPARTYTIEASIDLEGWEEIGEATYEGGAEFSFEADPTRDIPERYFRVITK